jgi:hypothetical protein
MGVRGIRVSMRDGLREAPDQLGLKRHADSAVVNWRESVKDEFVDV